MRVQEVTAEHAQLAIPSLGKGTQGRGPRMCESEGCVVLFKSSSRDQDKGEGDEDKGGRGQGRVGVVMSCVLKRTQMLVVLSAPQLEVVCDLKVVVYDSLSRSLDIRICIGWPKRRVPALQAILGAAMDVALRNYTKVAKFEYRIINVWVLWVVVSLPEYYWRSMTRRTLLLTGCHSRGDRVPEHGELGKTFSADAQRHHGERHGGSGDVWASDVGCRKEERHLGAVGGRKLARLLLEQREELYPNTPAIVTKKKFSKDNLSPGCTDDNVWRQVFLSAVAHFTSTYNNPWAILTEKLLSVLQETWDTVYGDRIEHTVTVNGPVYRLSKQSLNIWCSGFAAVAVFVLTTFFASNDDFVDLNNRSEFAKAMLVRNCFLFKQNQGGDKKAWSGLWRAPMVLQVFAHHFNYVQGRAEILTLDDKLDGSHGALALACTAVCRALTLVTDNDMSFNITVDENGDDVWTAVIPKGFHYEFNDTKWGMRTKQYLEPIKELSAENFATVLNETQDFVKKNSNMQSVVDSGNNSDYEDLFTFH
ncbi:hypothetical protein V8E55_011794 [Tylopilus felleus]